MSRQDVQNVRDWRDETRKLSPVEQTLDPVTIAATGAENSNLDWAGKRLPGDVGVPGDVTDAGPRSTVDPVQFQTRKQSLDRRATAAGATRSGNDADLLGFTGSRRRIGASRELLGY